MTTEKDALQPKVAEIVKDGNLEFNEKEPNLELKRIPTQSELEKELGLTKTEKSELDPEIDQKTNDLIDDLLGDKIDDFTKKRYVNEMGMKFQKTLSNQSKILDQSIKTLGKTQDGGAVATGLLDLRNQVEELNPRRYNLDSTPGVIAKLFRNIFGSKNPISRYFERYESAQHVITAIIDSLVVGKEHLIDDNKTLEFDKKALRDSLDGLNRAIMIGQVLYSKLENKLKEESGLDQDRVRFIQEELLFPLNQRVIDLQTTLAVNQQGVISYDLLIRNNNELITGVNRTITITASALRIAVTTRLALNKQRQVLDAKKKVDETTADLIQGNAEVLQTQGVEIQKQAAESTINVEKLTLAFESLNQAIDELSNFRREALPEMKDTVNKFKSLTDQASETISRMEKGQAAQEGVILDITSID
ncbi:MAG: toxic anion resistance protein [Reichenbachiella sp.]|uniref:toxic anion resistance protein n=1 Tax=Reichenbachiella sp. TaxID=2184521 RepID=UPI0032656019